MKTPPWGALEAKHTLTKYANFVTDKKANFDSYNKVKDEASFMLENTNY